MAVGCYAHLMLQSLAHLRSLDKLHCTKAPEILINSGITRCLKPFAYLTAPTAVVLS